MVLRLRTVLAATLLGPPLLTGCSHGHPAVPVTPGAAPATSAATTPAIGSAFFGMHILSPGSHGWPQVPIGSVRIWDTGTRWMDLQPTGPGSWSPTALAALDTAVSTALAHGAQPVLVLGQTPQWASRDPSDTRSVYGAGVGQPPKSIAAWSAYVSYLAKRYAGRVRAYEVWNEANFPTFFDGTPADLARLTTATRAAVKQADPHALVVSPSIGVRNKNAPGWVRDFLQAGGGAQVDVWSVHMYPPRYQPPEAMVGPTNDVLTVLRANGQADKPVWDTERAYGLASGGEFVRGSHAVGYVARGAILDAGLGISRSYWYAWEDHSWGGLYVSAPDLVSPSEPGLAFGWVRSWLLGARIAPCQQGSGDLRYLWSCRLRLADGTDALAEWAVKGGPLVQLPAGTTAVRALHGAVGAAKPGDTLRLGPVPVLVVGRFG